MGYLVATTGRLLLPSGLERQALTVAEHRMSARQGWFDPDAGHVDSLDDLAAYAGVSLERDGEWLTLTTDHDGDPKWSEQAEEFYRALSDFVQEGEVHLRGEDGSTWSYTYAGGALAQQGDNGWDEPPAAGGSTVVEQDPPAAPPQASPPGPPATGPAQPPEPSERPSPPPAAEPQEGGFSYPGKEDRPPSASPPPTPPVPAWTPGEDDDAPPASPGRAVAMTALLVVGVLLIIGLALVVSGF